MFLISEGYQHNSDSINYIKIINIKHVQLKLLIFKNNLILIGILEVLFIVEVITSTAGESINNIINCSQLINDIEIEF